MNYLNVNHSKTSQIKNKIQHTKDGVGLSRFHRFHERSEQVIFK